jgi:hypothetical protein
VGQATGLTIVVLEGEDAVNIIQQKTAVAPVVEVRDRNDQPVAGAVVRFAIQGGRATFNGARTLTVTTNAAGRAAVAGLTPTGSGALQISASAAFQGQTAAVTIAQTNVMTAAQAAQIATASGASATSSGGLSATTIGIIGGAVAGGTLAAREVLGGPATQFEAEPRISWTFYQGSPTCVTGCPATPAVLLGSGGAGTFGPFNLEVGSPYEWHWVMSHLSDAPFHWRVRIADGMSFSPVPDRLAEGDNTPGRGVGYDAGVGSFGASLTPGPRQILIDYEETDAQGQTKSYPTRINVNLISLR